MYVDRLVLFAYFSLLNGDLCPLKPFEMPLSYSYVGSYTREVALQLPSRERMVLDLQLHDPFQHTR